MHRYVERSLQAHLLSRILAPSRLVSTEVSPRRAITNRNRAVGAPSFHIAISSCEVAS